MRKLVFIAHSPLTYRHIHEYGIGKIAEYTEVYFWDVSSIIGNETKLPKVSLPLVKVETINSYDRFKELSVRLDNQYLVLLCININYKTLPLYKLIEQSKCQIATTISGKVPLLKKADQSKFQRILKIAKKISVKKVLEACKRCYVLKLLKNLRPIDLCFCAGSVASESIVVGMNENTKRIQFNSFDYQCARCANVKNYINGKYILFIDEYVPFHPDFDILGIKKIDAETYYNELNVLFEQLEQRYGIPVVIAPHPKAEKYHNHNYFRGRTIIWNDTNSLVYNSSFVVTHYSTAISYPVIYRKPILFTYTNDMKIANPVCLICYVMADLLNCRCINISEVKSTDVYEVDEQKYSSYLYSYITSQESKEKDNYRIILDLLQ